MQILKQETDHSYKELYVCKYFTGISFYFFSFYLSLRLILFPVWHADTCMLNPSNLGETMILHPLLAINKVQTMISKHDF